jgi:hypothetical protein
MWGEEGRREREREREILCSTVAYRDEETSATRPWRHSKHAWSSKEFRSYLSDEQCVGLSQDRHT